MRRFLSLLIVLTFHTVGLLIFTKGFLLKRTVIPLNSSCILDDLDSTMPAMSITGHRSGVMPRETGEWGGTQVKRHGCWMPRYYNKAIIILIDALRFDFIAESTVNDGSLFANKLPVVSHTLANQPQHARLYRFIADAPTTTLQRLKGLTTGSLPTFVDAGDNFASAEITEDNIIDQIRAVSPNITFMGDDTWVSLFPSRFFRSFPYPSFNTKDLNTVDDGVIGRLVSEIHKGGSSTGLVIAHLLGVDHCGHTYGPNTTAMADKLTQMNQLIESVMAAISDDTLLVVMGDHGMTRTGDHGGDSNDEINSAMFVYGKTAITATPPMPKDTYKTVSQIDLVPTLSLLLGAPIPFSNLGSVITDLFNLPPPSMRSGTDISDADWIDGMRYVLEALRLNSLQVSRYIQAYSTELETAFPHLAFERLDDILKNAKERHRNLTLDSSHQLYSDLPQFNIVRDLYITYLIGVLKVCQSMWAQFNYTLMGVGLAISLSTLLIHISFTPSPNPLCTFNSDIVTSLFDLLHTTSISNSDIASVKNRLSLMRSVVILTLCGLLAGVLLNWFSIFWSLAMAVFFILHVTSLILSVNRLFRYYGTGSLSTFLQFDDALSLTLWLAYAASMFSNSYVVWEQHVTSFLLLSLVLGLVIIVSTYTRHSAKSVGALLSKGMTKPESVGSSGSKMDGRLSYSDALLLCIFLTCMRASAVFLSCRDEHGPACQSSFFLLPLSALDNELKAVRVVIAVVSLFTIVAVGYHWLRHHGNLNGSAHAVFLASYVCPAAAVCVSVYWGSLGMPTHLTKIIPNWVIRSTAQTVFWLTGITVTSLFYSPLCLFLQPRLKRPSGLPQHIPSLTDDMAEQIPQLYQYLKANWQSHLSPKASSNTASTAEKNDNDPNNLPIVYGLATAYSSSQMVLITAVAIVAAMLLNDGIAPSLLLLAAAMFCVLELHARYVSGRNTFDGVNAPWPSICIIAFLAAEHFFTTAHQATISAIRFEAAFHGFRGDFSSNIIPATLISFNTFTSQILCTLSLPLLIYWPLTRYLCTNAGGSAASAPSGGSRGPVPATSNDGLLRDGQKGEFVLNENEELLRRSLFHLFAKFTLLIAIKMLVSMLAVTLHRRHLMVWKIFAPRFVYDGATFLIVTLTSLLTYLFVLRINNQLTKWIVRNIACPTN